MRVTVAAIVLALMAFASEFLVKGFISVFALTPTAALSGSWWQFVSYIFLHDPSNPMHIFLNLFVLMIFGPMVEKELGWKKYLLLFLAAGIGSAGFHIALSGISSIPLLGASGSVFGILTAYGLLYPRSIILVFPGIPMPAILAVFLFAGAELLFGVFGLAPGIANFGHLGGIAVGAVFMLLYKLHMKRRKSFRFGEFEWAWE